MRIPELPANTGLIDVSRMPSDFRFRLVGSAITDHVGEDLTGRLFSEMAVTKPGTETWERYASVAATGAVSRTHIDFLGGDRRTRRCWSVLMPLTRGSDLVERILIHVSFAHRGERPI